jgi:hypothetical protein
MDNLFNEYNNAQFIALTGVSHDVFLAVYTKYCGPPSSIRKPLHLFTLLMYYKLYPINRGWTGPLTRVNKQPSRVLSLIRIWEKELAEKVNELADAWDDRHNPSNVLPHVFPSSNIGCIDSFPIYVSRPTNSSFQSNLYNGKYGGHVLKVQAVCNHSGTLLWYSGPHIGTHHDVELYRQYSPPLDDDEEVLADLAYIGGGDRLSVPFKKQVVTVQVGRRKRRHTIPLSAAQVVYNRIHSWYRSTIEHTFGYVKRFRILNSTYRGRVLQKPEYIARAVRIIMHVSNVYLKAHPHRLHSPIIADRVNIIGFDFDVDDVREFEPVHGTRHEVEDFYVGQKVQVWLTETWWNGYVRTLSAARNLVTVRIHGGDQSVRVAPIYVRYFYGD